MNTVGPRVHHVLVVAGIQDNDVLSIALERRAGDAIKLIQIP